ncbi:hypothetical protein QLQ12_17180 [Actinoplanes sp. NEAU-A12]|uniref:ABC transporter permease n=1 Tax=Actinoplanes sandaracinus TaxID=3045177 RepID=A0ABT6WKT3_9ACTN|nr:hypothetical protein [Actinoplanes sandaracinus]MDI6100342.1 hypothetical protein [Actinoplanes sandaracinus]
MPSPPHTSFGLLGNVAAGYRLALVHRRRLLAVLLPVLTVALLGLFLLDVLLGRGRTTIVDGAPLVHAGATLTTAKAALAAVLWLIGLDAAALAATGAARGRTVRPRAAVVAALKRLPVYAIGLCSVAIGATLLLTMVTAIAEGLPGLIVALGTLTVAAVLAARLLIGLFARQGGGLGLELTSGRVTGTAGAVLLGGVVVPLVLAWAAGEPLTGDLIHPVVARVIGAILITGVVAAQAGLLAHVHLLQRAEPRTDGRDAVDLAAVDARLATLSGEPVRRPWAAPVATVLVLLAPAVVAAVNPFGALTVRSHSDLIGGAAAVAWPAGGHPVIATVSGARFCDNDVCDEHVTRDGGPSVWDGRGAAAISVDGTAVVKAAMTGGPDDGGPFIDFARCTREGCRQVWVPVRASAKEAYGWPELAVAVAPDHSVWFGLATASEEEEPGEPTFGVTLIRCPDATCAAPERHRAGTVERLPDDDFAGRRRTALAIGADGRPVLAIRTGPLTNLVTCDPVTCANPRTSSTFSGDQDTAWAALPAVTGQTVSFEPGSLRIGEQLMPLESNEIAPWSGAVTTVGSEVYATAAEATEPPGLYVRIGTSAEPAQPEHWRQVLWRCGPAGCGRQSLDSVEIAGREVLAASEDGRVLIVRDDRVLLVSAPARP